MSSVAALLLLSLDIRKDVAADIAVVSAEWYRDNDVDVVLALFPTLTSL